MSRFMQLHQIPSSHPAYLSAHIQERASRGGGSSVERLPIASKKLATTSSLSRACRRASGEAQEQRTRSSVCTKSSSGGLRRRPCCRRNVVLGAARLWSNQHAQG